MIMSDEMKETVQPVEEVTDKQDEKELSPENLDQVTGGRVSRAC